MPAADADPPPGPNISVPPASARVTAPRTRARADTPAPARLLRLPANPPINTTNVLGPCPILQMEIVARVDSVCARGGAARTM